MREVEEMLAELRRIACAYSQISAYFHEAYYGIREAYGHNHHYQCCDVDQVTGYHKPQTRGSGNMEA